MTFEYYHIEIQSFLGELKWVAFGLIFLFDAKYIYITRFDVIHYVVKSFVGEWWVLFMHIFVYVYCSYITYQVLFNVYILCIYNKCLYMYKIQQKNITTQQCLNTILHTIPYFIWYWHTYTIQTYYNIHIDLCV